MWIYLKKVNANGEYVTLNTEDGRINISRKVAVTTPQTASKTTIAEVKKMQFRGTVKLDPWFIKAFTKWENKFAKENPDQYNRLINMA